MIYGNNNSVENFYDNSGKLKGVKNYSGGQTPTLNYSYECDSAGNLGYSKNNLEGTSKKYIYDLANRLSKIVDSNGNYTKYNFDQNSKVNKVDQKINNNY